MIVGLNNRVCVQLLLHQLLLCLPQPTKPLSWSSSRRHHIATAVGRRRPDMPTILFDPVCRSAVENPSSSNDETNNNKMDWLSIPEALERRHACKAFARYDGQESTDDDDVQVDTASPADPWIVQQAAACLDLARLSPSAFNTQPYKVVLVHDVAQKTALSKACLGPNARRVLDADCTAVFLADKQVLRTVLPQTQWRRRRRQQQQQSSAALAQRQKSRTGPPTSKTTLLYITLFSSGYPLPRWLSAAISFLVRTAMSWFDAIARAIFRYPLPTLSNAETWATKQTSLVAMTYMLAAAAKGLATIPMEGLNAAVVRRVVGARGARYAVPLVVATGRRAAAKKATNSSRKNGGGGGQVQTRRYPAQQVLFGNSLQEPLMLKRNDDDDDDVAVGRTTTAEDDDETGSAGGGGSSDGAAAADAK